MRKQKSSMVKLKKYRIHKTICDTCNGNGFVKVVHVDEKEHVHQCWDCDSEGEFYVYEPRWLQVMMLITVIAILTSSCTNQKGEFNPITSFIRLMYTHGK